MASPKRCLGVDLGTSTVRVVELAREKDAVRVLNCASRTLGLDPNTPPEQRAAATAEAVRDIISTEKIQTKHAVFAVPGQAVFIKRVRLPRTSEERLARIINFEARQQIPFPLDKTQLEYQVFDEPGDPNVEVLMVAIKRDFVESFMKIVSATKLKPILISVSSLAQFNYHVFNLAAEEMLGIGKEEPVEKGEKGKKKKGGLKLSLSKKKKKGEDEVKAPKGPEKVDEDDGDDLDLGDMDIDLGDMDLGVEDVKAHLHVGASTLDITIARLGKRKMLGFTRSVPVAGNEITRMIMDRLSTNSFQEAEQIKISKGGVLTDDVDLATAAPTADPEVAAAATLVVNRLVAEVRRTLDFYVSQPDGVTVDSIVLSGGSAALPNFGSYLEEKIGLLVEDAQGPTSDRFIAETPPADGWGGYIPALGLAISGLDLGRSQVDFLPTPLKDLRQFKSKLTEVAVLGALLIAAVGLSTQLGKSTRTGLQAAMGIMEQQLDETEANRVEGQNAISERESIAEQFSAISALTTWRPYWPMIYRDLILKYKPPQIHLNRVDMTGWGQIRIQGVALDEGALADFQDNLAGAEELIRPDSGELRMDNLRARLAGETNSDRVYFSIYLKTQTRRRSDVVEFRDLFPPSEDNPQNRRVQRNPNNPYAANPYAGGGAEVR